MVFFHRVRRYPQIAQITRNFLPLAKSLAQRARMTQRSKTEESTQKTDILLSSLALRPLRPLREALILILFQLLPAVKKSA